MKSILFHNNSRKKLFEGIELLANAVSVTLGPQGRNVVLGFPYNSPPIITKDGVSVARQVESEDPVANAGVLMIRDAAAKTNADAGDGTTTATILAYEIIKRGFDKLISEKEVLLNPDFEPYNAMELKRGIDDAAAVAVKRIKELTVNIAEDQEKLRNVAIISSNNDVETGTMIADTIMRVGRTGVVAVQESNKMETTVSIVEGMELERGWVNPFLVKDVHKMETVLTDADIFIYNKKVSSMKYLITVLEAAVQKDRQLLLICDDIDGEALSTIVHNVRTGTLKACVIKSPGFGDRGFELLTDIAFLTGASIWNEENEAVLDPNNGTKALDAAINSFGKASRVVVKQSTTTIVGGAGDKEEIRNRIQDLSLRMKNIEATDQIGDHERAKLKERIAKLTGGVAVINVGATTELEMREKKDRIDDALHATRAALAEGIVPGGGITYLNASIAVRDYVKDRLEGKSKSYIEGFNIVQKALCVPFERILINGGLDVTEIKAEVVQGDIRYGYDARNNKYGDMIEMGVIDPAKVTRVAFENAVSIAGMVITTECVIQPIPPKESK